MKNRTMFKAHFGKIIPVFLMMTLSVMALTACSPFHPDKDLASSAAIEKSIDGLEKLDGKKTEQFLQAVNKKYAVTMNDVSAAADVKTVISVDLGELLGGTDFEITMGLSAAEYSMDQSGNARYTDLALRLGIPVLGDISLKCDGYIDAAEESSYTCMKECTMEGGLFAMAGDSSETSEDLNRWTRKKMEKEAEAETETPAENGDSGQKTDPKFTMDPKKVSGIYINKNNGSYIVDIGPEFVNDLQEQVEISGTENARCFVTFDKGLTLAGLWLGADTIHVKTDNEEISELDVKNLDVTLDLLAMNTGIDLKVPDDVKTTAVDQDPDEGSPLDMIEGIL